MTERYGFGFSGAADRDRVVAWMYEPEPHQEEGEGK